MTGEELRKVLGLLELNCQDGSYDICTVKEGHTHLLPSGIKKILALIKKADYVKLDEDQSLPYPNDEHNSFNTQSVEARNTVNRLLNAGWRKVILPKEPPVTLHEN